MKIKTVTLAAAMAAALCAGIWFIVSPSIGRQADIERQNELLESVMAAMPTAAGVEGHFTPIAEATDAERFFAPMPTIADDEIDCEPAVHDAVYEYELDISYDSSEEPESPDDAPCEPEPLPLEPLNEADFPSGITPIGILSIDSIGLRLPVMEGVDEPELKIAPGRLPQTAAVGEIGNAVIFGHRNYAFGSMFNRLGEVENGDTIGFQAMSGEIMAFEVFEILVVEPDSPIAFVQPKNESIITLYTCTPVRVATHRLLIRARKIEGGI